METFQKALESMQKLLEFILSYPPWIRLVVIVCVFIIVACFVFGKQETKKEYGFWIRVKAEPKAATTPENTRYQLKGPYPTLKECLSNEQSYPYPNLLVHGCGCADPDPTEKSLIEGYAREDIDLMGVAKQKGVLGKNVKFTFKNPPFEHQKLWYIPNVEKAKKPEDRRLLDEGCEDCAQAVRDYSSRGDILFGPAVVNVALFETAKQACLARKPYAWQWLKSIANDLAISEEFGNK